MGLGELRQVDPDDFFDFSQEKFVRLDVGKCEESLEKCGQRLSDCFLLVEGEMPGGGEGVMEGSWRPLGRSWAEKGGQHASNLPPKRSQNQLKIDPKIDQFFSASWNRFLEGFWWILDAKMKQS